MELLSSADMAKHFGRPSGFTRSVGIAALVSVLAVGALLGVRRLRSEDLGYHLAYGERFWQKGEIVDHNDSLYTLPSPDTPPDQRPEPMAGAWYDSQGRYRFPNANWLTQILFAGVFLVGGFAALNILLMVCIWGLLALVLVLMRRLGAGLLATAAGGLLALLVLSTRLALRPELISYLLLAGQAVLLAPVVRNVTEARIKWPTVTALVVLQWILANSHSYAYIGWGLTAAVAVEATGRRVWGLWRRGEAAPSTGPLSSNVRTLAILLVLQAGVCFLNPWTWRLVALPAQAAAYFREHQITQPKGTHPWSWLNETDRLLTGWVHFKQTCRSFLTKGFEAQPTRPWFGVALLAGAVGALVALARRQWCRLLWLAAGVYLAFTMYRNMGLGTLLMLPAMASLGGLARRLAGLCPRWQRRIAAGAASAGIMTVCGLVGVLAVGGRLYPPSYQIGLGMGRSRVVFPDGPARWLNQHAVSGRIWPDMITSSNLYFLLERRPEFPILTNGWAYPPSVMAETFALFHGHDDSLAGLKARYNLRGMQQLVDKYDISAVVVRTFKHMPLIRRLDARTEWKLVFLDGAHALFLRTSGPDGELARQEALDPSTWSAQTYVQRAKSQEVHPAYTMYATGSVLGRMGWHEHAIVILTETVALAPDHFRAWLDLGTVYAIRAQRRRTRGLPGWRDDAKQAEHAYLKSLAIRKDRKTRANLSAVRRKFGLNRPGLP